MVVQSVRVNRDDHAAVSASGTPSLPVSDWRCQYWPVHV